MYTQSSVCLYFVFLLDNCNWSCESQTLAYEEDAQNLQLILMLSPIACYPQESAFPNVMLV